jgi:hypothetical protein
MKKVTIYLLILVALFLGNSLMANASVNPEPNKVLVLTAAEKAHAEALIFRLNEIKRMDKSNLTRSEKKNLRKEVRAINKDLVRSGGGIYLSIGVIIIVILLLVILI